MRSLHTVSEERLAPARRRLLQSLAATGAAAVFPWRAPAACADPADATRSSLAAARCAERWIRRQRIATSHGVTWPRTPGGSGPAPNQLYHGAPGVVLFYLELYGATGDTAYLREALAGAEDVAARNALPQVQTPEAGLYMGLSGQVFVLAELGKLAGAGRYTQLARRYLAQLTRLSRPVGEGVEWNDFNDIVYGTAGIGLVLLYAHRRFGDEAALELARRAGLRLIDTGIAADGGLRWEMEPTFEYYMPNFSHGTSGVGYFLAELYAATGDRRFLDAAVQSTRHLLAIADTANGQCRIVHDDGPGKHLHFYGWCHGPAGTARLFHALGRATGDPSWNEWVERGARTVLESGVPEKRSEGYWNNFGSCCGDAAVMRFFLDLYQVHRRPQYLQFAQHLRGFILEHATQQGDGCSWVHAEGRRDTADVSAQTGYMQGAAGIGAAFLRFDALERGRAHVVLPDSPFTTV